MWIKVFKATLHTYRLSKFSFCIIDGMSSTRFHRCWLCFFSVWQTWHHLLSRLIPPLLCFNLRCQTFFIQLLKLFCFAGNYDMCPTNANNRIFRFIWHDDPVPQAAWFQNIYFLSAREMWGHSSFRLIPLFCLTSLTSYLVLTSDTSNLWEWFCFVTRY